MRMRLFCFVILFHASNALQCYTGKNMSPVTYSSVNGSNPVCVYVVALSDEKSPGKHLIGCSYDHLLPKKCSINLLEYDPEHTVEIGDEKVKGALLCCTYDFCNSRLEALSVIRIDKSISKSFVLAWPSIVVYFLIVASAIPIASELLSERRLGSLRRAEKAHDLHSETRWQLDEVKNPAVHKVSPRFATIKELNEVLRTMEKRKVVKAKDDVASIETKVSLIAEVAVYKRDQENPQPVLRIIPTQRIPMALRLIEHGPYKFNFDPCELGDLFDSVADILRSEPSLIEISGECHIYGCLDGDYGELYRWLMINGWPPKKKIIFLGGFTSDSSEYSLELLALVFALKQMNPDRIFLIRGASEVYDIVIQNRFSKRVCKSIENVIQRAFGYLPLGVLIEEKVLCVHGGLPFNLKSLDCIRDINRPIFKVEKASIASDLIFSQPANVNIPIPGARGWYFNGRSEDYNKKLSSLGLELVIRTRNHFSRGYELLGRKTICIYSSTRNNLPATSAILSGELQIRIAKMVF